jgi:hypothetical protein
VQKQLAALNKKYAEELCVNHPDVAEGEDQLQIICPGNVVAAPW